jgi:dienelactone hydrolase
VLSLLLAAQITTSPVSFPSKAGDGVTLNATLYQPTGVTTPVPAVVVLHTCAGLDANDGAWANWFAENGYIAGCAAAHARI